MLATSSTTIWYTMRATGVVALVLLSAAVAMGLLTAGRAKSRAWPAFAQADLHKRLSLLAMVFLAFHVLTAVLDTYVHVGWMSLIVPFASPYRPLWTGLGTVGVDLMVAVAVSSALRQRISARTWRSIHWLAYGSWPVAMAHSFGMGTDAATLWLDATGVLCTLAVGAALAFRLRSAASTRHPKADRGTHVRRPIPVPAGAGDARIAASGPTTRRQDGAVRLLEKERS
jgi:sulfoxide reductase heme-binding subunit YedZ